MDQLNVRLIPASIAIHRQVLVELYRIVTKKMVLQPTVLPVSVGQLNVLLLNLIVIKLLVFVVLNHRAA